MNKMTNMKFMALGIFTILLISGCVTDQYRTGQDSERSRGTRVGDSSKIPPAIPPKVDCNVKSITTIKEPSVKDMDWSHTRNLIAFGKYGTDGYVDVAIMKPDGSEERCLTCN